MTSFHGGSLSAFIHVRCNGLIAMTVVAVALAGCAGNSAGNSSESPGADPVVTEGFAAMDDGTRLFYRTVGEGPRTVFIPADLYLYPAFTPLADGRRLIFYDMRNRGRSDSVSVDRENSIDQDVRDLEALRRHFGVQEADLIGYSYLGLMVVMYAMAYPQHTGLIVQLGPVPLKFGTEYPDGLGPADWYAAIDSTALAEVRRLRAEGLPESDPRAYCEREWEATRFTLVGNPNLVDRLGAGPCDMPNEWPTNLNRHLDRHFTSVQQLDVSWDDVARVMQPVLTIHGTMDRNAPYGGGREWCLMLPDARLITIDGAAHNSWVDAPDLVLESIDTFLDGGWPVAAEHVTSLDVDTES